MLDLKNILDLTPLLFVISLSILTNYIGDTISFKTQELFKNNIMLKHCIIILLIYSTLSIFYKNISPVEKFKKSIITWIMYLLLVKNTLRIVSLLIILMFLQFILKDYIDYYKNKDSDKKHIDTLNKLNDFLEYVIIILLIIGHIMYINKQKDLFKTDFSYYDLYLSNKKYI